MEKNLKGKIEEYFSRVQYEGDKEITMNLKPKIIEYLKSIDLKNEEDFTMAIRIAVHYIPKKDFAREFGFSQPTLEKYLSGKNAPHPAMRPPVIDYIINRLSE
jgi:hypothetical protein